MGITAVAAQSDPEVEQQLLEERYSQLLGLRDSLPHITGTQTSKSLAMQT